MTPPGPQIYVSADAEELGAVRDAVEAKLREQGAVPVVSERRVMPGRTLTETIRERVQDCRAVIHIAGHCAGPEEPDTRGRQTFAEGRRSFAQLEFDLAVELRKELHVFSCAENFPDTVPEPVELRRLQHAHRSRLVDGTLPYREFRSLEELLKQLRPLCRSFKDFARPLQRRHLPAGLIVAVTLLILVILAGSVWWKIPRPQLLKIQPHQPGVPPSQDPR